MEQKEAGKRKLRILVVLTLMFIWGNSLMPGEISDEISGVFNRYLGPALLKIFGGTLNSSQGHGLLRKMAHGTEFFCLGIELNLLLLPEKLWSNLILGGVLTALCDETIQLFVPERCGQIKDVWIDLLGFMLGVLLCQLLRWHRKRKNRK